MTHKQKFEDHLYDQPEIAAELKVLEEGCIFRDPTAIDWAKYLKLIVYTERGNLYFKEVQNGSVFNAKRSYLDKLEIIGKPYDLRHVLMVLKDVEDLYINGNGVFSHDTGHYCDYMFEVDLTTPPQQWSEETFEQLCKLLNV